MAVAGGQSMAPAPEQGMAASANTHADGATFRATPTKAPCAPDTTSMNAHPGAADEDEDMISDTVGAIAVDRYGNIAAGSSSGGIGAKHRGRIGPAALVGIGTYVIPVDPSDPDQVSVASITSGTGEHIATTMAAQTSAARLYYCQKKRKDGTFENVSEDEAMNATIATEFMGELLYSLFLTAIDRERIVYNLRRASRRESKPLWRRYRNLDCQEDEGWDFLLLWS
jgi:taspase (threonine aspartase 1)